MKVYFNPDPKDYLQKPPSYREIVKRCNKDDDSQLYIEVSTLEELWALLDEIGTSVCITSDSKDNDKWLGIYPDDPSAY